MRVGELMNSGLTHSSATAASQNARKISMEIVPMSACSLRTPNDFGGACASAAVSACDGVRASMRSVLSHFSSPACGGGRVGASSLHGLSWWRDGPPPPSLFLPAPPPRGGGGDGTPPPACRASSPPPPSGAQSGGRGLGTRA